MKSRSRTGRPRFRPLDHSSTAVPLLIIDYLICQSGNNFLFSDIIHAWIFDLKDRIILSFFVEKVWIKCCNILPDSGSKYNNNFFWFSRTVKVKNVNLIRFRFIINTHGKNNSMEYQELFYLQILIRFHLFFQVILSN